MLVVLLAAIAATLSRQRRAILKPAVWSAGIGIPVVTALMALSGAPPAEAFVFSAASSLVWAPIFGLLTWSVTGMQEAGFRIGRDGRVTRSAWAPEMRAEATSGPRAETRRPPHPPAASSPLISPARLSHPAAFPRPLSRHFRAPPSQAIVRVLARFG
ncbi:MAG TPA: hypothetical protein VFJ82_02455 [Longimicrobium sp.]|nr:hypothetical protein [Longimicrobium sp.]